MRLEHIRQRLYAYGAKPCHAQHVLRLWVEARAQDGGRVRPEDYLPLAVRDALPQLTDELHGLARLRLAHRAADDSERLLVELADGQTVESVLLPRDGLCVSTQVGCAVGCTFCMTGRGGLLRPLAAPRSSRRSPRARTTRGQEGGVHGHGEPSHNLDNVLERSSSSARSAASVTKTSCFRPSATDAYSSACRKARSSRHSRYATLDAGGTPCRTDAAAAALDPEELVELAERFAATTGYPIQYQWTLLEGSMTTTRNSTRSSACCAARTR